MKTTSKVFINNQVITEAGRRRKGKKGQGRNGL